MQDNPYYEEVKYSLELFKSKGFMPIWFNDGDDDNTFTSDINEVIEGVLSVEEAWVRLSNEHGKVTLYFVLGNEPGVAICDYSTSHLLEPLVDTLTEEIYNHFNP